MKMKWITEKTGKNSGKNRGILGAAGRSLKVFLAAGVLGIFLSGTAFAASGEDAYRKTMPMFTIWRIYLRTKKNNSSPDRRRRFLRK